MLTHIGAFADASAQILAGSGSDDGASNLAFLFLFSGFVFYGVVYFKYRNVDKRHGHESETASELHNVRAGDRYVRSLKGLSNAKMKGANNRAVGARGATWNPLSPS